MNRRTRRSHKSRKASKRPAARIPVRRRPSLEARRQRVAVLLALEKLSSPLHSDVPLKNSGNGGGECGIDHRFAPLAMDGCWPGMGSETSRKSPVASRRYTDVLSAVRWPRMSPIVLSGVPFLSN